MQLFFRSHCPHGPERVCMFGAPPHSIVICFAILTYRPDRLSLFMSGMRPKNTFHYTCLRYMSSALSTTIIQLFRDAAGMKAYTYIEIHQTIIGGVAPRSQIACKDEEFHLVECYGNSLMEFVTVSDDAIFFILLSSEKDFFYIYIHKYTIALPLYLPNPI